ncbi:hypothetical protein AB0P17_02535 [Streptomyces sp. NPDC088124]|uniref:hypothetical protein n=1 Tax=Streptomyces sp. NPDC088124 TaxID=3154654 RepID=UPI003420CE0D
MAGVGKATSYCRWQGKKALALDLLREPTRRCGVTQRSSVILSNVIVEMKSHRS